MNLRKRITVICCCLISIIFILSMALYQNNSQNQQSQIEQPEQLFMKIFSDTKSQYNDFSKLDADHQQIWLQDRYQEYMTEDGFNDAMQNRILLLGVIQFGQKQEEMEIHDISIQKRSGKDSRNWYNYKVTTTKQGKTNMEYIGSFELTEKDGKWLVNAITRQNT